MDDAIVELVLISPPGLEVNDNNLGGLRLQAITSAPLRRKRSIQLEASGTEVFATVSTNSYLDRSGIMIKRFPVDQSATDPVEIQKLYAGYDDSMETISAPIRHKLDPDAPPEAFAFNSIAPIIPVTNQLSIMVIREKAEGGCELTWRLYYQHPNLIKRFYLPYIASIIMKDELAHLEKTFGKK